MKRLYHAEMWPTCISCEKQHENWPHFLVYSVVINIQLLFIKINVHQEAGEGGGGGGSKG